MAHQSEPRLYREFADWWPLLSSPADYAGEADEYWSILTRHAKRPVRTLLELGSGGGNNASHLKRRASVSLVDRSPGMLDVSRRLNPECEHVLGDMRDVRLGREFDAVFIHDAASYLSTPGDVASAMRTARAHCAPGGTLLVTPDHVRETFRPSTTTGGHDGHGRALRYLCWTNDDDPDDGRYEMEMVYMLREGSGPARVEHDLHVQGLFPRHAWVEAIGAAGLHADAVTLSDGRTAFLGTR